MAAVLFNHLGQEGFQSPKMSQGIHAEGPTYSLSQKSVARNKLRTDVCHGG